jgi:hypothetical protein
MSDISRRVSPPTTHDLAWFVDLAERDKLEFDPPYQRRSVWNQDFKNHYVDTILLGYPSPPIFLFKRLSETGQADYAIVDGKQRLTTILEFVKDKFVVGPQSPRVNLRGKKFSELESETKIAFFDYDMLVDFLPTNDEAVVNDIFDRLNRNVARLQPQELRHAKHCGVFISRAEILSLWTWGGQAEEADEESNGVGEDVAPQLPDKFPRVSLQARRTMKDVEIVASLFLLLEEGVKTYSMQGMDEAFASRDVTWPAGVRIEDEYRRTIVKLRDILTACPENGWPLLGTRLANQADFYSLFGAIAELNRENILPEVQDIAKSLGNFVTAIGAINLENSKPGIVEYFKAARSNSNDKSQRETRIRVIKDVLLGTC